MKRFRYRALVELDRPVSGSRTRYAGGTRGLMIHARSLADPSVHKYLPATISTDDQLPFQPGDHVVVTLTVTDDDAPSYLGPGQSFTLWGESTGHGIISRALFTDPDPA
jgi:hypothetical protein